MSHCSNLKVFSAYLDLGHVEEELEDAELPGARRRNGGLLSNLAQAHLLNRFDSLSQKICHSVRTVHGKRLYIFFGTHYINENQQVHQGTIGYELSGHIGHRYVCLDGQSNQ